MLIEKSVSDVVEIPSILTRKILHYFNYLNYQDFFIFLAINYWIKPRDRWQIVSKTARFSQRFKMHGRAGCQYGPVAQWIARTPSEREVVGSSPIWVAIFAKHHHPVN